MYAFSLSLLLPPVPPSVCTRAQPGSKGISLAIDGTGPVATAFREQRPTVVQDAAATGDEADYVSEFGIKDMKRAQLAREFGIQAIRFEPTKDGVVEIGRAPQLLQAEAKNFLVNPAAELFSIGASIALLILFAIDPSSASEMDEPMSMLLQVEAALTSYFVFEYAVRWWAAGTLSYALTPLMLIDLLNILPFLIKNILGIDFLGAGFGASMEGALSSLRALRILRLRKFLGREEVTRLARAVTGNPTVEVPEVQRVIARVAFSIVAIVLVSAGALWSLERPVNSAFSSYLDALYFSITTLTTVGFGDVVPISQAGRAVVALEMICAVTIIPFELTSLSRTLADDEQRRKGAGADDAKRAPAAVAPTALTRAEIAEARVTELERKLLESGSEMEELRRELSSAKAQVDALERVIARNIRQ